ncbi:hypothetical protein F0562_022700 [Nyssa sinensis]|uniref:Uncharacterized protein n=1 Tax=Nyssa sinensis TaxID=561372 RepID=A0A5J5BFT7_9ASTE|nr:hypothetical protein F0562_022700 [Nyssa sinensis]
MTITGFGSSWQFYVRMGGLLKGTCCLQSKVGDDVANGAAEVENLRALPNSMGNLENHVKGGQDHVQDSNQDNGSNAVPDNNEFSTLQYKMANVADRSTKINALKRRSFGSDVAESIMILAHSILKIEQTGMEMYRESERLRLETEMKRAEMDLKRTEIIAKTQLQIVKLFVKRTCNHNNESGDSSLVAEPIVMTNTKENEG